MGNASDIKHWDGTLQRAPRSTTLAEKVVLLSCADAQGIAHRLACFFSTDGCQVVESAQYRDVPTARLFMRIRFTTEESAAMAARFATLAAQLQMTWQMHDTERKMRVVLMVSKAGHCLNDLLFRWKSGLLPVEIAAVISNHPDFETLSVHYGVPFLHLPVAPAGLPDAGAHEQRLQHFMHEAAIDLLVLARYMQVLSPALCALFYGRVVNIHHSFLPSFKGARPYGQAHEHGVKLIGATAHFVTADLDEGPIIEQDVRRVDHAHGPEQLSSIGRDAECLVLARAVQWIAEHRVILNGRKTVIFH